MGPVSPRGIGRRLRSCELHQRREVVVGLRRPRLQHTRAEPPRCERPLRVVLVASETLQSRELVPPRPLAPPPPLLVLLLLLLLILLLRLLLLPLPPPLTRRGRWPLRPHRPIGPPLGGEWLGTSICNHICNHIGPPLGGEWSLHLP